MLKAKGATPWLSQPPGAEAVFNGRRELGPVNECTRPSAVSQCTGVQGSTPSWKGSTKVEGTSPCWADITSDRDFAPMDVERSKINVGKNIQVGPFLNLI